MRRAPWFLVALLGLASPLPVFAQERPKLAASLAACETGPDAAQRFAVFTGSMPAMRGTHRMSMRFDLEERGSDVDDVQRVAAPTLGRWNRSKPGVAGFVYTKRVTRLGQGRWYRATVRFRWHDVRGRVQRTARRVTTFCHQPDQRPNLQLESLRAARPGSYLVTIVNAGLTPAPESIVGVEPRPETSFQRRVPPLAPGERTTVVVEGDRCEPNHVVVVQLDAGRVVDESREDDNRVENACPGADRLGAS
jgi:CARDB